MILIISEKRDISTTEVMKWLHFSNEKFIRINKEDKVQLEFYENDITIIHKKVKVNLSDIQSVWYRRGKINNEYFDISIDYTSLDKGYQDLLKLESHTLKGYFYYKLHQKKHINSYYNDDVNKLICTDIAETVGLKTPRSFILNTKEEFDNVAKKHKLITKTMFGKPMVHLKNQMGLLFTEKVSKVEHDIFYPSLFQENIDKKYELRIFFLNDKTYTMAIFSQKNDKTKTDFRKYDTTNPNRTVPFKLPKDIDDKVKLFMKKLGRNCGSIDMLVSQENEYYFLEINPFGQFGMVSIPCNYNLEKVIATELAKK